MTDSRPITVSILCVGLMAVSACAQSGAFTPSQQSAIEGISADAMRRDLAYLASDELEGRNTPSPGLRKAADFIADQFRKAGLQGAAANGSYFQTAPYAEVTEKLEDFRMLFRLGTDELNLSTTDVRVRSTRALDFHDAEVIDLPGQKDAVLPDIAGKIVAGDSRRYGPETGLSSLQARKPALIILMSRRQRGQSGAAEPTYATEVGGPESPVIYVINQEARDAVAAGKALKLNLHVSGPSLKQSPVENVVGVLPGSDPLLARQYVILSAHYDHLGKQNGRIFYGANDNGSGTVSLIAIARALALAKPHPKRTVVFLALFGEEEGLLGASYYTRHPLFPLKDTVADINLEQIGRTDDHDAKHVKEFSFTGPSYSDLPATMSAAARLEKIAVYPKSDADEFFARSDNYVFAEAGIVAHTIVVAYEYPDYHEPEDKWEKVDFANMAAVDRGIAAGLLAVANAEQAPHWSAIPATARYRALKGVNLPE